MMVHSEAKLRKIHASAKAWHDDMSAANESKMRLDEAAKKHNEQLAKLAQSERDYEDALAGRE